MKIASFDIGLTNFAQYIEEISDEKLSYIKEEFKNKSCNTDDILQKTILCGTRVQTGVYNFSKGKNYCNDARINVLKHFKKYYNLYETCDIFIIEKQFWSRTKGNNVIACRISEALYMWLLDKFETKTIYLNHN